MAFQPGNINNITSSIAKSIDQIVASAKGQTIDASIKRELGSYWMNIAVVLQLCIELASRWKPFTQTSNPELTAEFFLEMLSKGEACGQKAHGLVNMHETIMRKHSIHLRDEAYQDLGRGVKALAGFLDTQITAYNREWNAVKQRGGTVPVKEARQLATFWINTQPNVSRSRIQIIKSSDDLITRKKGSCIII